MKILALAAVTAASLALASCGGKGDDALGDNAAKAADARADNIEAVADNSSGAQKDALEAQADVTRETGEAKEEAIDDADVNAEAMTPEQKNALVNAQ